MTHETFKEKFINAIKRIIDRKFLSPRVDTENFGFVFFTNCGATILYIRVIKSGNAIHGPYLDQFEYKIKSIEDTRNEVVIQDIFQKFITDFTRFRLEGKIKT
jgi:hypothetical protein